MDQQLVIKLTSGDGNGVPVGLVESPPMLYSNLKKLYPTINFSEKATPSETEPYWYGVFEWAFKPIDLPYNKSFDEAGLTKDANGIWKPTFIVRDATQEEINSRAVSYSARVRDDRDFKLISTDWFDNTDSPLSESKKEEYRLYRQALRDIPLQDGFPFNIQWPEIPK
jgi:hypothetical protein